MLSTLYLKVRKAHLLITFVVCLSLFVFTSTQTVTAAAWQTIQHQSAITSHAVARPPASPGGRSSPGTHGGHLRWRYLTGGPVSSSPAAVNGVVYVGSGDGSVYALRASNGILIWRYLTGASVVYSPAVGNGLVYVVSTDGYIYALNSSDGTLIWRYLTGEGVVSTPAVVKRVVYVGSWDDYVYALTA